MLVVDILSVNQPGQLTPQKEVRGCDVAAAARLWQDPKFVDRSSGVKQVLLADERKCQISTDAWLNRYNDFRWLDHS